MQIPDLHQSQELEHAKSSISNLEEDLRQERAKLRSLATERNKSTREMADVMSKLERTEAVGLLLSLPFSAC